jgi:serine/threonine-protein kinase
MIFKFVPILLGTLVIATTPVMARADQANSFNPQIQLMRVNLTPQQQAQIEQLKQQNESQLQNILTPEQWSQFQAARNAKNWRGEVAVLKSVSPQQNAQIQSVSSLYLQQLNAVFTPQQREQQERNVQARIAQLKAENKLPRTFHLGFWQPTARVNPDQPLQLEVTNETNLPLQYGLTTDSPEQILPGSSAVMNSVSLPADVLIYPSVPESGLKYDVTAIDNIVFVKVRQVASDAPGDGSLVINRTGAIYIY